jgi:hypothetical protein
MSGRVIAEPIDPSALDRWRTAIAANRGPVRRIASIRDAAGLHSGEKR